MKSKLNQTEYGKLSDELKKEYKANGDDYILDVDGKDIGALLRAKEHEKEERLRAEGEAKAAEKAREAAEKTAKNLQKTIDENSGKEGDIDTLNKSWKEKHATEISAKDSKISEQSDFIKKTLLDSETLKIAAEISKNPTVMTPHIQNRLTVDFEGDKPTVKVLDSKGQISALTTEDLKKEFRSNEHFSDIILASKASGSSTTTDNKDRTNAGGSSTQTGETRLSGASGADLVAHIKASKGDSNQE